VPGLGPAPPFIALCLTDVIQEQACGMGNTSQKKLYGYKAWSSRMADLQTKKNYTNVSMQI